MSNSLAPAAKTEIFRTRLSPETKAMFARCSAALGMRSATHNHMLITAAIDAHVRREDDKKKETHCRPLKHPASRAGFVKPNLARQF